MDKAWSIYELVVDLVCFIPPLKEIQQRWQVPPHAAEIACLVAASLLAFSMIHGALGKSSLFGGQGIAVAVASVCVVLLAFGSIRLPVWRSIFATSYVALVMLIRFVEGWLIGDVVARKSRPSAVLAIGVFVILGAATYLALAAVPKPTIAGAKAVWALGGAVIASIGAAGKAEAGLKDLVGNRELRWFATFLVLLSTMIYVSSSEGMDAIYKALLPLGWVAGVFVARRERPKNSKRESAG